jgi:glycosyltransferase involved in cell wall biosynthesis
MEADRRAPPKLPSPAAARRLRILQVVPAYYPAVRYGGPIRSVHGLSVALAARGHAVHVYTTSIDGAADLDVPLDVPVDLDGVTVRYFPVPALRRLCWAPALANRLKCTIDEFDVIHLHSVFLWPTWAAARAASRAGVPYITAPRGMLVRDIIHRKNRVIKTLWINLVERTTFAHAAGVHVTAELEAAELRALSLRLPEINCIPNGVDIPTEHLPLSAGPFAHLPPRYALFVGRISWKKGLDRLVTALQWIPGIPLVIAGNDDEGYRAMLEALARSLGVADRLIFLGPVSDSAKWALYEHAQVFVLPSYSENFGNVVAEAMAMGCPVVVSPEVGIAALVQASGAGVVTDGMPERLAATIRDLLADDAQRAEMGRRGRETARSRLSWSGVAAQMESLYLRILDSRFAARAAESVKPVYSRE